MIRHCMFQTHHQETARLASGALVIGYAALAHSHCEYVSNLKGVAENFTTCTPVHGTLAVYYAQAPRGVVRAEYCY